MKITKKEKQYSNCNSKNFKEFKNKIHHKNIDKLKYKKGENPIKKDKTKYLIISDTKNFLGNLFNH